MAPPPIPEQPASAEPRLLGMRLPAFIAFSVGSLGAGGAVLTRLAASAPYNDPKLSCQGRCADHARTLDTTSVVLTSFAAVAVGAGVVLALTDRVQPRVALAPVLKLGVSPSKAAASALWSF